MEDRVRALAGQLARLQGELMTLERALEEAAPLSQLELQQYQRRFVELYNLSEAKKKRFKNEKSLNIADKKYLKKIYLGFRDNILNNYYLPILLKKNCLVSTKHSETKRQFTRYNTLQV